MRRVLLFLGIFCWLSLLPVAAQQPSVEIQAMLASAEKAVNNGDLKTLQMLSADNSQRLFPWLNSAIGNSGNSKWHAEALKLPNDNSNNWLVVFWAYHLCQETGDHVYKLVQENSRWKLAAEIPETETFGFRILDHNIRVKFDLAKNLAEFTNEVLIERSVASAELLALRISADFKIQSITANGQSLAFTQAGGIVLATAPVGRQFTITLNYRGECNHTDFFFSNFVAPSEIVLTAFWYPTIARLPATNTVTAVVPKGWTVISQGNLIARSDTSESSTFTYRMDLPNSYFSLDAGPYYIHQKIINGRRYNVYLLKSAPEIAAQQLDMMDASFELFERLWGPYPFDHYTIVETQQRAQGALEAYTFTSYGKGLLPSSNPHEWAHNWWGGIVPCTYLKDIWNEAFATYAESLYYRFGNNRISSQRALDILYRNNSTPALEKLAAIKPLSECHDVQALDDFVIGYIKGGLVLQHLEDTIGFDTLMRCMRTFRALTKQGEARTWDDFERVVNQVTGKDYSWWFNQWIRRAGLPHLQWENVKVTRTATGYLVNAELVQKTEPYLLNVPIVLETVDAEIIHANFEIKENRTHIEVASKSIPKRLILDPQLRLPRVVTQRDYPFTYSLINAFFQASKTILVCQGTSRTVAEAVLKGIPSATIKDVTELTEADVQDANLFLIGELGTGPLINRLMQHRPYHINSEGITLNGRTYQRAAARAFGINPFNSAKHLVWITDGYKPKMDTSPFKRPGFNDESDAKEYWASVLIFDLDGNIIDAEAALPEGGESVYQLQQ
ncbi:MAG: M1 family aminopeptidase [Acidobacteriota bacterium]